MCVVLFHLPRIRIYPHLHTFNITRARTGNLAVKRSKRPSPYRSLTSRLYTFRQQQQAFNMGGPGPFTVKQFDASRRASCPARGRSSYSASRLWNWWLSAAVEGAKLGRRSFVFRAYRAARCFSVLVYTHSHTHSYSRISPSFALPDSRLL